MKQSDKKLRVFNEPDLSNYNRILLFPHIMPDGDCVGSAIAMYYALVNMGKEVYVVLDDELPNNLEFLNIDENDNKIIVDSKFIEINNIDYDLCITLDLSNTDRLGDREKFIKNSVVWNIDHHKTNILFGNYHTIMGDVSSAGEVLYTYFERMGINITSKMAECLYTAISTDSGSFIYDCTTSRTLYIASKLMDKIEDFNKIITNLYLSKSKEMLVLHSMVLNNMKFYSNDKIVISYLDNEMLKISGAKMDMSEGIVEEMRNISGVEVSCLLKEKEYGMKVSLRSKSFLDVSKIAFEHDGGGHNKAAGFNLYIKDVNEAIEYMKNILEKMVY